MRSDREETLEAEIARLDGLGLPELRQVWRQRLGPPPRHISTELTRRRLAYELQVKAYGDLLAVYKRSPSLISSVPPFIPRSQS